MNLINLATSVFCGIGTTYYIGNYYNIYFIYLQLFKEYGFITLIDVKLVRDYRGNVIFCTEIVFFLKSMAYYTIVKYH